MENINLRSSHGIAKGAGVALCLSGVIMIAFYVGPAISSLNHHFTREVLSHQFILKENGLKEPFSSSLVAQLGPFG
jgi:hypothetical protein